MLSAVCSHIILTRRCTLSHSQLTCLLFLFAQICLCGNQICGVGLCSKHSRRIEGVEAIAKALRKARLPGFWDVSGNLLDNPAKEMLLECVVQQQHILKL